MQTYWVRVCSTIASTLDNRSVMDSCITDDDDASSLGETSVGSAPNWAQDVVAEKTILGDRLQRLVDWNVDQLIKLLKRVVANREGHKLGNATEAVDFDLRTATSILQEVTEVVPFPKPNEADLIVGDLLGGSEHLLSLDSTVATQLREYMTTIAKNYNNDNAYHNFAHSSHCAMALTTWLSHVLPAPLPTPEKPQENSFGEIGQNVSGDWTSSSLSKSLFALQSDPLTHFALVFASLIKDLEHTG